MSRKGHPDSATLALHAGGDLGWFQAWRTERHLAACGECRDEVAAYRQLSEVLPQIDPLPGLNWGRMAAEMRANIRLGLAAGECVGEEALDPGIRLFTGFRAALATAAVLALVVTGTLLQRPAPVASGSRAPVVVATGDGIERRAGDRAFALMHTGVEVKDVTYRVSAQGTMGASYVDPQTNLVTQTKLYVE